MKPYSKRILDVVRSNIIDKRVYAHFGRTRDPRYGVGISLIFTDEKVPETFPENFEMFETGYEHILGINYNQISTPGSLLSIACKKHFSIGVSFLDVFPRGRIKMGNLERWRRVTLFNEIPNILRKEIPGIRIS